MKQLGIVWTGSFQQPRFFQSCLPLLLCTLALLLPCFLSKAIEAKTGIHGAMWGRICGPKAFVDLQVALIAVLQSCEMAVLQSSTAKL
jgi:hypothetical protein